jgi:hypothetical protein
MAYMYNQEQKMVCLILQRAKISGSLIFYILQNIVG